VEGCEVKPYFERDGVTVYHGDARDLLPQMQQPSVVITDPVWPNSVFPSVIDPAKLFAEAAALLTGHRLIVHLGCSSDPRFLAGVPARLPFVRVCWLRYARPSYRGRILVGSDVAYVFGSIPASRPGCHVLAGETIARNNTTKLQNTGRGKASSEDVDYTELPHPCPRRYEHVAWLVGIYGDGAILDPFMGTGTTLEAAMRAGRPCVGIDSEERNCEISATRLSQRSLFTEALV
jgi:site-specific DNA-methyltransferase (adenine-specific)